MNHEELVDAAIEAAKKVFSDKSVSTRETLESLGEIADEIAVMIDALKSDLQE